jgi:peptidoglycan hydrolase-like protein with peptidoglycan-binding domain
VANRRAVPAGPPRQLTPTPDRYREIQQALIDKGYLKSEANGAWDAQSTDALQRFQNDRKLAPTGKINAASLIGLGLGPKTAGTASLAPPAAPGQTTGGGPVEVPPAPDVIPVPDAAASR